MQPDSLIFRDPLAAEAGQRIECQRVELPLEEHVVSHDYKVAVRLDDLVNLVEDSRLCL